MFLGLTRNVIFSSCSALVLSLIVKYSFKPVLQCRISFLNIYTRSLMLTIRLLQDISRMDICDTFPIFEPNIHFGCPPNSPHCGGL